MKVYRLIHVSYAQGYGERDEEYTEAYAHNKSEAKAWVREQTAKIRKNEVNYYSYKFEEEFMIFIDEPA